MGTTWTLAVVSNRSTWGTGDLQTAVASRLEELESQMSHWRPDSLLSRFNRAAAGEPFPITPEMATVMDEALSQWRETAGAFDVTVAPLVDLWGFGPAGRRHTAPDQAEIEQARQCVGSQFLTIERVATGLGGAVLKKLKSGVRLDLSAIAKGFAVDEIARLLDDRGYTRYLFELGGELRARGTGPTGQPWRVGLEQPESSSLGRVRRVVALRDAAVATSGDYRQCYRDARDGQRYSHIIDPRTGRPAQNGVISASVIAPTAMRADALATALMVLGPEAGYEFATRRGIRAVTVIGSSESLIEKWTPGFEALVAGQDH